MRPKRYSGMNGNNRKIRDKYADCERMKVEGVMVRKLTPSEIAEWRLRMQRIMYPGSVSVLVRYRRSVV